ncbi:hypothetical protein DL93DRAFT_2173334 [Clavulina sp. PMI_390]|nr:hypothetical protein DL93DRAFT_2173334 [Clavulina sp. PMI_390]
MDEASVDQAPPLSSDEFREWAPVHSPTLALLSLDHVEVPPSTGLGSFSPPVQSDLAQRTLDVSNSDESSARRRERTTSVNSIEDAGSSRPRKRVHLDHSSDLPGEAQESIHQHSSSWHGGKVHHSALPQHSQTYPLDHRPQGYTQTTSYSVAPTVASRSMHGLPMHSLGLPSGPQTASNILSSSSLLSPYDLPSARAFAPNPTLRESELTTFAGDRNPGAPHPHPHSLPRDAPHTTNAPLGPLNLLARFGILDPHDLSQLPRTESVKILNQIYVNLQNHAPGSVEYPHALRLLQDCCSHASALPTQLKIENVMISKLQLLGRGGEAVLYKGQMDGRNIVIREPIPAGEWGSLQGGEIIQRVHREAIIHSQLRHPNILPFLGVYYEGPKSPPLVILPFHERGSLQKLLADLGLGGFLQQSDLIRIVVGSARGAVYLHSRTPPIIHGDLHPGNILLDAHGDPVLCDFGLSRIRHEISRTHSIREEAGRMRFLAPELHYSSADQFCSTQESDVFALAMTFFYAWSSQAPFFEIKNENLVVSTYIQGLRPMEPATLVMLEPRIKTDFWELIATMWAHDVSRRPTSSAILEQLEGIFNPFKDSFPMAQTLLQSFNPHGSSIEHVVQPLPTPLEVRQQVQMPGPHYDLQSLQYAKDADQLLWNHKPENICLLDTRTDILKALINWAKGGAQLPECPPYLQALNIGTRILWLCGVAGSGKSSIALSVALEAHNAGVLGAYYCFNTAHQAQLNPSNLFTTIACQLAARDRATEKHLITMAQASDILIQKSTNPSVQLHTFLLPLLTLSPASDMASTQPHKIIVIDAVDESGSIGERKAILKCLAELGSKLPPTVKILVTSRFEVDIQNSVHPNLHTALVQMDQIPHESTEADIRLYVHHMLKDIHISSDPAKSEETLTQLAIKSEQSFQWASTACLYISNMDDGNVASSPAKRMKTVLSTGSSLYSLYTGVFNSKFGTSDSSDLELLQMILGMLVAAQKPLSLDSYLELSYPYLPVMPNLDAYSEAKGLVCHLASLMSGTDDTSKPLVPLHTSFTDFLQHQDTDEKYRVDVNKAHCMLASGCFHVMQNGKKCLCFNICKLETSTMLNSEIYNLAALVQEHIGETLSYACQFWPVHCAKLARDPEGMIIPAIQSLLTSSKLLNWLEVLSLIGLSPTSVLTPIAGGPLEYSNTLKIKQGQMEVWPSLLQHWQAKSSVNVVAFAPKRGPVAAGLESGEIQLWSVETGQQEGVSLSGHDNRVTSVAFSPDGALLASGSVDNTIRLWNVQSQTAIGVPLTGHDLSVTSVAFSPDGALLASAIDKTIQLSSTTQNFFLSYINVPHHSQPFNISMSPSLWYNIQNGWLKGPGGELVLWIPAAYGAAPYHEQLVAILGRGIPPVPHVNFDNMVLGTDWVKCHTPLVHGIS